MDNLNVTISMRAVGYEDGSYAVELMVLGLSSEHDAEKAIRFLEGMLCAEQIKEQ
ncbi:MAG: hypothetical protein WAO76_00350 [Georgfuchsia sp.]